MGGIYFESPHTHLFKLLLALWHGVSPGPCNILKIMYLQCSLFIGYSCQKFCCQLVIISISVRAGTNQNNGDLAVGRTNLCLLTTESLTLHSFGFWGEVGCRELRMGITYNATCVSFHSASAALCKAEQWHSEGRCNSCPWEHSLVPHTPSGGSASPYHLASLRVITAILFLSPRELQKSVIKHAKKNI